MNKVLMEKRLKLNILFLFVVFLFIAGHGIYLNTPWVNLEYSFAEATRTILNPNYNIGLEHYWEIEANPLGYSLVTAIIASFLDISFWSVRIPSLLGGIAILFAGWAYYRKCKFKQNSLFMLWALFFSLNPLVWIYSGRATADILPVGLVVLAFLFCYCAQDRLWIHFIGGLCFSLAALVKFHSVLLGLGFAYIIFTNQNGQVIWGLRKGINLLFYSLLPAFVLGIYFFVIYKQFGIVFIPEKCKEAMIEGYDKKFISIFLMYSSYLTMMLILPIFLCIIHLRKAWSQKNFYIFVTITIVFGIISVETLSSFNMGEMGYSNLYDAYLNQKIVSLIRISSFILAFFFFAEIINAAVREKNEMASFLLCSLVPFLIIISFFKPAQRYLLFCFPFVTFYLVVILGSRMPRLTQWIGWPSAFIFSIITLISVFYQIGQGRAQRYTICAICGQNSFLLLPS
ncbi:MAG: ArnT family glycosyltransferase [Candidatus Brocadia sp.]